MKRIIALFLMIPSAVFADTILTVNGNGPGASYGTSTIVGPGINGDFYAGSYDGTTNDGVFTDAQIYCVDTRDDINFGAQYLVSYSALTPSSTIQGIAAPNTNLAAADNIAAVMGASYGGVGGSGFVADPSASGNPDWNTGLQIALWNAEYNGLSLLPNGGPLYLGPGSSGALVDANLILSAAISNYNSAMAAGFLNTILFTAVPGGYGGYDGRGQDMVTWLPPLGSGGSNVSSLPEPSSFALLGLGGIGLAISAYRRRRSAV